MLGFWCCWGYEWPCVHPLKRVNSFPLLIRTFGLVLSHLWLWMLRWLPRIGLELLGPQRNCFRRSLQLVCRVPTLCDFAMRASRQRNSNALLRRRKDTKMREQMHESKLQRRFQGWQAFWSFKLLSRSSWGSNSLRTLQERASRGSFHRLRRLCSIQIGSLSTRVWKSFGRACYQDARMGCRERHQILVDCKLMEQRLGEFKFVKKL